MDYAASIAQHTSTPGTGPFQNGAASGSSYADFDQSYDPLNGLNYQQTELQQFRGHNTNYASGPVGAMLLRLLGAEEWIAR